MRKARGIELRLCEVAPGRGDESAEPAFVTGCAFTVIYPLRVMRCLKHRVHDVTTYRQ